MEQVIVEIPEDQQEGWQPPVLRQVREAARHESCFDIFFAQYAVCILVLTVLLTLRVFDEGAFRVVTERFCTEGTGVTTAVTELAKQLWS